jgi:Asp/Glu/hydantoin racemase
MQDQPAFWAAYIQEPGTLNQQTIEGELVKAAQELVRNNPKIGALLLECSDMPPYAAVIQDSVHMPVFDFITMADFVYAALARSRFSGVI